MTRPQFFAAIYLKCMCVFVRRFVGKRSYFERLGDHGGFKEVVVRIEEGMYTSD